MRARDRDAVAEAHELREHLGAAHDRDPARVRGEHLGVVRGHRARHDDDVGLAEVLGRVAFAHAGAERRAAAR